MASIRLQFVLGADFASCAIAWFTQGTYSHVDAVVPDDLPLGVPEPPGGWLLGARNDKAGGKPPGVQLRPPNYTKWARRTVIEIPCTDAQKSAYWAFLINQLGKPYDKAAILGFVFNRNWREKDSWICSEVQAAAGEDSAIFRKLNVDCNKIAPVPLALIACASGGTVIEDVTG